MVMRVAVGARRTHHQAVLIVKLAHRLLLKELIRLYGEVRIIGLALKFVYLQDTLLARVVEFVDEDVVLRLVQVIVFVEGVASLDRQFRIFVFALDGFEHEVVRGGLRVVRA